MQVSAFRLVGRLAAYCSTSTSYVRFPPIAAIPKRAHVAAMKALVLIVGIAALLVGMLWIGQGAGLINWPASSFMIDQRPWVTRGAILAVIGLVLIGASRIVR